MLTIVQPYTLQVGIAAFAPQDLTRDDVNIDDRPYASLVYLANSRQSLEDSGRTVIQSTLTVGILGTHIAKVLQKEFYKLSKSDSPQGWKHQIANGGEPTLRYTYASQHLLINSDDRLRFEVKYSNEGSLGFLTEVNSSLLARWGLIKTPWWSFASYFSEHFCATQCQLIKSELSRGKIWSFTFGQVQKYALALITLFYKANFVIASCVMTGKMFALC